MTAADRGNATGVPLAAAVFTLTVANDIDTFLQVAREATRKELEDAVLCLASLAAGLITGHAEVIGADPAPFLDAAVKKLGVWAARFDEGERVCS